MKTFDTHWCLYLKKRPQPNNNKTQTTTKKHPVGSTFTQNFDDLGSGHTVLPATLTWLLGKLLSMYGELSGLKLL